MKFKIDAEKLNVQLSTNKNNSDNCIMTFKSTKTSQKFILLQTNCSRASCLGGPRFKLCLKFLILRYL